MYTLYSVLSNSGQCVICTPAAWYHMYKIFLQISLLTYHAKHLSQTDLEICWFLYIRGFYTVPYLWWPYKITYFSYNVHNSLVTGIPKSAWHSVIARALYSSHVKVRYIHSAFPFQHLKRFLWLMSSIWCVNINGSKKKRDDDLINEKSLIYIPLRIRASHNELFTYKVEMTRY